MAKRPTDDLMRAVHDYGRAIQNGNAGSAQGQAYHSVCSEADALDTKFNALLEACEAALPMLEQLDHDPEEGDGDALAQLRQAIADAKEEA